jgi:uncharacterized phage protein (TIGR01671 family)
MSEIKYRGFDRISDSWVTGYPVEDADVKNRWWIMFNDQKGAIIDDPETIGQYIGLKDNKDIEIFEGDILRIKDSKMKDFKYKVCQLEKAGFLIIHEYGEWGNATEIERVKNQYNIQFIVIGNIHENPELFNEKKH